MPEINVNVARLALYGIDRFVRPHLICPPETLADMIAESADVTSLYRSIKVYWASKSQPDMDIKSRYVRRLIINCATDVKCKLRAYVDNHSDNALERTDTFLAVQDGLDQVQMFLFRKAWSLPGYVRPARCEKGEQR